MERMAASRVRLGGPSSGVFDVDVAVNDAECTSACGRNDFDSWQAHGCVGTCTRRVQKSSTIRDDKADDESTDSLPPRTLRRALCTKGLRVFEFSRSPNAHHGSCGTEGGGAAPTVLSADDIIRTITAGAGPGQQGWGSAVFSPHSKDATCNRTLSRCGHTF
jgi:hypothetical protein